MSATPVEEEPGQGEFSSLERLWEGASGAFIPLAATVLAFFIGGLVVLLTGHNPLEAYRAIFNGAGFNWFFPWVEGAEREAAAGHLQQTLNEAIPLILTALAVSFAFRCGLFNIGGQGQYWVGFLASLWIGTHLTGLNRPMHIAIGLLAGILGGAVWGGIAGILRATVGAHEVITTIMLNWIAILGRPVARRTGRTDAGADRIAASLLDHRAVVEALADLGQHPRPRSACRLLRRNRRSPRLLPDPEPHDARLRGPRGRIQPRRGGLQRHPRAPELLPRAGHCRRLRRRRRSGQRLGIKYAVDTSDFGSTVAFTGIAVALLGRNKPVGIFFAALLFAGLEIGTSTRATRREHPRSPSLPPTSQPSSRRWSSSSWRPTSSSYTCWRLRRHLKTAGREEERAGS